MPMNSDGISEARQHLQKRQARLNKIFFWRKTGKTCPPNSARRPLRRRGALSEPDVNNLQVDNNVEVSSLNGDAQTRRTQVSDK